MLESKASSLALPDSHVGQRRASRDEPSQKPHFYARSPRKVQWFALPASFFVNASQRVKKMVWKFRNAVREGQFGRWRDVSTAFSRHMAAFADRLTLVSVSAGFSHQIDKLCPVAPRIGPQGLAGNLGSFSEGDRPRLGRAPRPPATRAAAPVSACSTRPRHSLPSTATRRPACAKSPVRPTPT